MYPNDIANIMREWAPEETACSFDNCGMMLGFNSREVTGVYVSLDLTTPDVKAAIKAGCNMIVTHHPALFNPARSLTDDGTRAALLLAAENGISNYAAHTNLDAAAGGVNDCLAEKLGLVNIAQTNEDGSPAVANACPALLRRADLPKQMTLMELARYTADRIGTMAVEIAGDPELPVESVLILGGQGGEYVSSCKKANAQILITGEAKHHERILAAELGLGMIIAGHYTTERWVLPAICRTLQNAPSVVQCKIPVICGDDVNVSRFVASGSVR